MNSALLSNGGVESNVNNSNLNFYLQANSSNNEESRSIEPTSTIMMNQNAHSSSNRDNDLFDGQLN